MKEKKWPEPETCPDQKTDLNNYSIDSEILQIFLTSATPVSIEYLCQVTGKSNRDIQKRIQQLRRCGVYICSSSARRGYYIGSEEEAKEFKAAQIRRARSIMRTCSKWQFGEGEQLELEFENL